MSILRYTASADTTITNGYQSNLVTRGTGANTGLADSLEIYSIYGQATTSSAELSRILINFPISKIEEDRTLNKLPDSGSVSFYLKLFNIKHTQTVPKNLKLLISPVSRSWQEGTGLDLDGYTDLTKNLEGANWINAGSASAWLSPGGDYLTSSTFSKTLPEGIEDLEVEITSLVEDWLSNSINRYGVGIRLQDSQESSTETFYTKKFSSRTSEFFFKRPIIEARWNSSTRDDRSYFIASSSNLPPSDNLNSIYLYNRIRGTLKNIPAIGTGNIYIKFYDSPNNGSEINSNIYTGSNVSTGIYKLDAAVNTKLSFIYDRWFNSSLTDCYLTGTINVIQFNTLTNTLPANYYMNITNLKKNYNIQETSRFNLYVREKNWSPNIYTIANQSIEKTIIPSASYKIVRVVDDLEVIKYGTGSSLETLMSYDFNGNYFDLDMSLFEPGYSYKINVSFYDEILQTWLEQPYSWKFKVVK